MSCLTFIVTRLPGDVQFHASTNCDLSVQGAFSPSLKVTGETAIDVAVSGVWTPSLTVTCAILCPTSLGDQYLWSSEHLLISFDGQRFILRRNN